jgi:hypothetical protein
VSKRTDRELAAVNAFKKDSLGRLLIDRIENSQRSSMADTTMQNRAGVIAWVEAKALESWPARPNTAPLRGAFEKGQLPFLRERISWGGKAFVLAKIESDWLLLNPMVPLEEVTKQQLFEEPDGVIFAFGKEECIKYLENMR